ncbi:protein shisa-4 isoform X1 [Catharus ustulatus]|uniref:protein shisa-4 isoform X1 n=1 Tax=Catharus ustulatus TaxID=91951 RepID=UPI0014098584|nr:protein shisa-4 isoform X1 [Catharus ustulatus]
MGCRKREMAGGEDCLWYLDRNGSWHPGFDCEFFTFCCGTCQQRYCCQDPLRLLTERQQRHCHVFSPKTIAGIASAVVLFIAIVTTIVCCFMCSCCYLYQRRQHLRTPLQDLPNLSCRPGNPPVQLPPCSSSSSHPRGLQSRPFASPAWLHPHGHVSPAWPCCPVPHVPLWPPCLLPHSTTSLRPGTAQLSWSISPGGDPCTRRRPAGPSWGPLRTPLALEGCPSRRWIRLFLAILG